MRSALSRAFDVGEARDKGSEAGEWWIAEGAPQLDHGLGLSVNALDPGPIAIAPFGPESASVFGKRKQVIKLIDVAASGSFYPAGDRVLAIGGQRAEKPGSVQPDEERLPLRNTDKGRPVGCTQLRLIGEGLGCLVGLETFAMVAP